MLYVVGKLHRPMRSRAKLIMQDSSDLWAI
jgi:hypothetical protein